MYPWRILPLYFPENLTFSPFDLAQWNPIETSTKRFRHSLAIIINVGSSDFFFFLSANLFHYESFFSGVCMFLALCFYSTTTSVLILWLEWYCNLQSNSMIQNTKIHVIVMELRLNNLIVISALFVVLIHRGYLFKQRKEFFKAKLKSLLRVLSALYLPKEMAALCSIFWVFVNEFHLYDIWCLSNTANSYS